MYSRLLRLTELQAKGSSTFQREMSVLWSRTKLFGQAPLEKRSRWILLVSYFDFLNTKVSYHSCFIIKSFVSSSSPSLTSRLCNACGIKYANQERKRIQAAQRSESLHIVNFMFTIYVTEISWVTQQKNPDIYQLGQGNSHKIHFATF